MSDRQEYAYSQDQVVKLLRIVSQDRILPYYNLIRGTPQRHQRLAKAFILYRQNVLYSEAMYPALQGFEIGLRNRVHNELSIHLGPTWYDKLGLLPFESEKLVQAKKEIADKLQSETPGRIVGELSFAFWVRLFSSDYEALLWEPFLKPMMPVNLTRGDVYARFKDIKTLRNRIAHHSRIIDRALKVRDAYEQVMESIGWLSPAMKEWVKATSRADEVLPKPMYKRPMPATPFAQTPAQPPGSDK